MRLTAAQVDRACGAVIGSAVGDALGAPYEFGVATLGADGPQMIGGGLGAFAPGEWTDDTSMAWAILDVAATGADLRSDEALTALARNFRRWYDTGPADIGNQTRSVLSAGGPEPTGAALAEVAADLHRRTGHTAGNGSLMRTGPVALAHLDDPEALAEAARRVSALTHHDPQAQDACVLWCAAVRHAVLHGELDVRVGLTHLDAEAGAFWEARIEEAETQEPGTFRPNGWVVTAFQAAWSAIAHTPVPSTGDACRHYVRALQAAIAIGDDTDTVAAIAGALLGARWGMSAIPARWRRPLHGYPGLTGLDLEGLAVLAARGGEPAKYGWPLVDHIDYRSWQHLGPAPVPHPYDEGVLLAGAPALDDLADDVDAVVSLCLTGRTQVPARVEHVTFRLLDESDPAANPNVDFVIRDAAATVAALRAEGKKVLLHCVAGYSRTPTVAIAYAAQLGVPLRDAIRGVLDALPGSCPNPAFQDALERLADAYVDGTVGPTDGTGRSGEDRA